MNKTSFVAFLFFFLLTLIAFESDWGKVWLYHEVQIPIGAEHIAVYHSPSFAVFFIENHKTAYSRVIMNQAQYSSFLIGFRDAEIFNLHVESSHQLNDLQENKKHLEELKIGDSTSFNIIPQRSNSITIEVERWDTDFYNLYLSTLWKKE